jgi:hypothetical protein
MSYASFGRPILHQNGSPSGIEFSPDKAPLLDCNKERNSCRTHICKHNPTNSSRISFYNIALMGFSALTSAYMRSMSALNRFAVWGLFTFRLRQTSWLASSVWPRDESREKNLRRRHEPVDNGERFQFQGSALDTLVAVELGLLRNGVQPFQERLDDPRVFRRHLERCTVGC